MAIESTNFYLLFFFVLLVAILYSYFEAKQARLSNENIDESLQNFLRDDPEDLGKAKKPILWIHVPYEYNSRNWLNFGSRSSLDLNQPYLYLTVRSIIKQCQESFTICIVDDNSFKKLIPGWNIDMTRVADPILSNMRLLGMMKLLYIYGGMFCPLSFVCLKNLDGLYQKGTRGDKAFVCEVVDKNSSSVEWNFFPTVSFCGAPKECPVIQECISFIQQTSSHDYTANVAFLGEFDRWCMEKIEHGQMNLVSGQDVGTKTLEEDPILLDDLLSNQYINVYPNLYGILIPSKEILNRVKYQWFARLSPKQILESDTIVGNYIMISLTPDHASVLEPLEPSMNRAVEDKFVGFWKTPDYPGLYGLKPNYLGNHLQKVPFTGP